MNVPIDIAARIPLAPVLLAQAVMVRRRALVLPEPPGPREGEAGAGPPLRLLIAGDSSAAGVGAETQDTALSGRLVARLAETRRVTWRLEAQTGATTRDTLRRLSAMPAQTFDIAVTALGVNDVTRATPLRRWVERQEALVNLLRDRFGVRRVYATGLPPMGVFPLLPQPLRWVLGQQSHRLDRALADILEGHPVARHVRVDFPHDPRFAARDGFHPSEAAYDEWAALLAGMIAAEDDPAG